MALVFNITNPVTKEKIGEVVNGASSATPNDTDLVMSVDTSVAKKNTWTQIKAFLKTYFDTVYQVAGTYLTSANITQTITNGVTTKAPSEDAVFDALALKLTKSHTINMAHSALNPADSTSYFFGANVASAAISSAALRRKPAGITGAIYSVTMQITISTSLGTGETSTFKINNVTQGTSVTVSATIAYTAVGVGYQWDLGSPLAITKGDSIECQIDMPAFSTNPVAVIHYVDLICYGF